MKRFTSIEEADAHFYQGLGIICILAALAFLIISGYAIVTGRLS